MLKIPVINNELIGLLGINSLAVGDALFYEGYLGDYSSKSIAELGEQYRQDSYKCQRMYLNMGSGEKTTLPRTNLEFVEYLVTRGDLAKTKSDKSLGFKSTPDRIKFNKQARGDRSKL